MLYHEFSDLANELKTTEKSLLMRAADGEFPVHVWYAGKTNLDTIYRGPGKVFQADLLTLLGKDPIQTTVCIDNPTNRFAFGNVPYEVSIKDLIVLPETMELFRANTLPAATEQPEQQDKPGKPSSWITGDVELCEAFGVGPKSISAVRRKVKKLCYKFEYEPETKKKRLQRSIVNEILAGVKNKNTE